MKILSLRANIFRVANSNYERIPNGLRWFLLKAAAQRFGQVHVHQSLRVSAAASSAFRDFPAVVRHLQNIHPAQFQQSSTFLFSLHLRRMARSAMDATRFTATGPCAHSKPGTRASVLAFADPPPPNETPQQKVARLREAARRAKLEQVSRFDKVVAKGRVVADTAHRFTAITLIAATGM